MNACEFSVDLFKDLEKTCENIAVNDVYMSPLLNLFYTLSLFLSREKSSINEIGVVIYLNGLSHTHTHTFGSGELLFRDYYRTNWSVLTSKDSKRIKSYVQFEIVQDILLLSDYIHWLQNSWDKLFDLQIFWMNYIFFIYLFFFYLIFL